MAPAPHEATTRHLGALYPFLRESGLGEEGVLVGRDLLGAAFRFDPFALYRRGVLTNPNMVVAGQLGRGKSAFVKTWLWRQAALGRRAWVVDPKGEYGGLARAWGVTPVALRPGGAVRLNPLDAVGGRAPDAPGEGPDHEETVRGRVALLASLAEASLGRALTPPERGAVELAVTAVSRPRAAPSLPDVVEALLHPDPGSAAEVGTDAEGLRADGRHVALELRRLVSGDLRGMFDGPTTPGVKLDASLVVLDLSAVYHSAALGALMACATAWLHGALAASGGAVLVVDEAWAILANVGVARWLQSSWKLSRARGVANVAVLHRLSDLDAAGARGSEQVGLATGLLADSETRVVYAQSPGEVERTAALLGLSTTEADLLPHLGRGVALWKVGTRSFLVEHRLSPHEHALVDTDAAMGEATPEP